MVELAIYKTLFFALFFFVLGFCFFGWLLYLKDRDGNDDFEAI